MSCFAIFVTVKLKPGSSEAFRPLILANATASVRDEPDCRLFHVLQSEDDPDTFHIYEVYSNPAALDYHRRQPYYKAFYEAAGALMVERNVQRLTLMNPQNTA